MSKILFIGDSITDAGYYIGLLEAYIRLRPQLGTYEFDNIGLSSENTTGLTETGHPCTRPYIFDRIDKILNFYTSDTAVIMYGVNEGIYGPFSEDRFNAYKDGINKLVNKVKASGMKVWLCTPTVFDAPSSNSVFFNDETTPPQYGKIYGAYNSVMTTYSNWVKQEMTSKVDKIIDINHAMTVYIEQMRAENPKFKCGDGIHPDLPMSATIAECLLSQGFNINSNIHKELKSFKFMTCYKLIHKRQQLLHNYHKQLLGAPPAFRRKPLVKEKIDASIERINLKVRKICGVHIIDKQFKWTPCEYDKFVFKNLEAVVVKPEQANIKREFLWRTEFFGAFPDADKLALSRGYHVVYINIINNYGSKQMIETMKSFYDYIIKKYNFNKKATFLGLSRGALSAVNFADEYHDCVKGLILDSPVVNIRSWPKGEYSSLGSLTDWQNLMQAYRMTQFDGEKYQKDLTDKLADLAKRKIPTVVLSNTHDEIVPYKENGAILVDAFKNCDCILEILRQSSGHHPHGKMSLEALNFIELQSKN